MTSIVEPLKAMFVKERIVFWYDVKNEFRREYETIDLPGVTKLEVTNNEYTLKYRMLRQEPQQKFLVYLNGPAPTLENNWLLDLQLASGSFRADQMSLWLAELGLGAALEGFCRAHQDFFSDDGLRTRLKVLLKPHDGETEIRSKMIASVLGSGNRLEEMVAAVLREFATESTEGVGKLARLGLADAWWELLRDELGYTSAAASPADLALQLFKSVHQIQLNKPPRLKETAKHILEGFRDNSNTQKAFDRLSAMLWKKLDVETELTSLELDGLLEADLFEITEKVIISKLASQLAEGQLPQEMLEKVLRSRKPKHWYKMHEAHYECLANAGELLRVAGAQPLSGINTLEEGIQLYADSLYLVDQLYRKAFFHFISAKQPQTLRGVMDRVEGAYTNQYLTGLGNKWKLVLDKTSSWNGGRITEADRFYEQYIQPLVLENRRVAVIISDALRYEAGRELARQLETGLGVSAEVTPTLGMLPSYTQLGMAALLPHHSLAIAPDGSLALADGLATSGTANRQAILQAANPKSVCLDDEFVLSAGRTHLENEVKANQVVYIFHNQIDAAGDKIATEETTFEAVDAAQRRIRDMVDKLLKVDVTNIFITTDHGFVYQQRSVAESDYSSADLTGLDIVTSQRRFIVGRNLEERFGLHLFSSKQLGLAGDWQFGFPTGYSRLRLSGSGARYVHGGTSLQEVVIPVIRLATKVKRSVERVTVTMITPATTTISTGQISLSFLQQQPVSEGMLERQLRIGLYAPDGALISDRRESLFNFSQENAREREVHLRFLLSNKAREYNNQTVILKMEEPIFLGGTQTADWQQYGPAFSFLLKQSITTDF